MTTDLLVNPIFISNLTQFRKRSGLSEKQSHRLLLLLFEDINRKYLDIRIRKILEPITDEEIRSDIEFDDDEIAVSEEQAREETEEMMENEMEHEQDVIEERMAQIEANEIEKADEGSDPEDERDDEPSETSEASDDPERYGEDWRDEVDGGDYE